MESAQQQNPSSVDVYTNLPGRGNTDVLLTITTGASVLALLCGGQSEDVRPVVSGFLAVGALWNPAVSVFLEMVICYIEGHYWPLGKDSTVIRLGSRRFCFCLPSLLYGLTLPDSCTDEELRKLEEILTTFCKYENRAGEEGSEFRPQEPQTDFWASAYQNIMDFVAPSTGTEIASTSAGEAPEEVEAELPGKETTATDLEVQLRRSLMVNRASRFSVITRLVGRALLRGLVTQERIRIVGAAPSASRPAMASVRAISDVVDVGDLAMHIKFGSPLGESNRRFPSDADYCWMFAESGLTLMLRLVIVRGLLVER